MNSAVLTQSSPAHHRPVRSINEVQTSGFYRKLGAPSFVDRMDATSLACQLCGAEGLWALRMVSVKHQVTIFAQCPDCGHCDDLGLLRLLAINGKCRCGNPFVMNAVTSVVECPRCSEGFEGDKEYWAGIGEIEQRNARRRMRRSR